MNTAFRASVNLNFYWGNAGYSYHFNGKETDGETGIQDYGMRMYNRLLGRFMSVDPLFKTFSMLTPYQFASNMPIAAIDLDGEEAKIVIHSAWFRDQIDAALDGGDFEEAERLTWCAVNASMPNGQPAATFESDPNNGTGFNVQFQPADGSAQVDLFGKMTGIVYAAPLESWASGSPNPMIARNAEIAQEIANIDAEIASYRGDDDSILAASEQVTNSQLDGDPPFDDGNGAAGNGAGSVFWTIDANMKIENMNARVAELKDKRSELQGDLTVYTAPIKRGATMQGSLGNKVTIKKMEKVEPKLIKKKIERVSESAPKPK